MHHTIKYTFEYSQSQIAFLDTTVYIDQNRKLRTMLYKKRTDRSFLLQNDSHHPKQVKEGIIYSQALRYNMIINTDSELQTELYNLTRTLLARHYPLHIINRNITKALQFTRHDLLHKTKKLHNKPKFLPFGIYERDEKLRRKIQNKWLILYYENKHIGLIPFQS